MHLQNLKLLHSTIYEMHLQDNTLFDPNDHMKGQHHVFYVSAKFEVAMSNGSGEDTITKNMMDGWTHRQTMDPLWYELNIRYYSILKLAQVSVFLKCHLQQLIIGAVFKAGNWFFLQKKHKQYSKHINHRHVLGWILIKFRHPAGELTGDCIDFLSTPPWLNQSTESIEYKRI